MRAAILIGSLLLSATSPAFADTNSELAKCSVMAGSVERLQCFDTLAASLKLDGPQPVAVPDTGSRGKWSVSRSKNPIDDTETVTISLEADEGKTRYGGGMYLFIARCKSNSTEAYIVWDDYLGNDGDIYDNYKVMTVRIGSQPAEKQRWTISTDSKATFAPEWSGALLKRMAGETSFLAQVTPYNESPVTAIFDTTGMKSALQPLADLCKWKID